MKPFKKWPGSVGMSGISNNIHSLLAGLGVALYAKPCTKSSPELIILAIINSMIKTFDPKAYSLLIGWLELYKDSVRIESLKALLKKSPSTHQKIAAAIAHKVMQKDYRWNSIINLANNSKSETLTYIGNVKRLKLFDKSHLDQDFLLFNIYMVPIKSSPQKKYRTIEWIVKNNIWIRNRKLMGCTLRADVYTLMQKGSNTPYATAKKLSASMSAVYSNWNDLKMVLDISKIPLKLDSVSPTKKC